MAVGEWDERQLCPDGACVGVIGPEGTCKVCGRVAPNWGDERNRGLIDPPDADADDGEEADDDDDDWDDDELAADGADGDGDSDDQDDDDEGDEAEADDAGDSDAAASASIPAGWTSRQLCPDGACIGVIGPGGRCKVCGKRPDDSDDSDGSAGADPGDSLTAASGELPAAAAQAQAAETAAASDAGADSKEPV